MFPYVSFGLNRLDSQPWVLIFLALYFLFKIKFDNKAIFQLWVICIIISIFSMLYITNDLNIIYLFRAITNYTIVFFVWSFSIIVHLKYNPIKHYIIASWIYNIYAILQIYGLNFLDWASQNRTTIGRGQTSLAAEPTYNAIIIFFISWLIINNINKNDTLKAGFKNLAILTIGINILSIFFIAKSATVILMILSILLFSMFLLISKRVFFYLIFFALLISIITYINYDSLSGTRPLIIINQIIDLGFSSLYLIIYNDMSINGRVAQVVIPYIGLIENFGLPGGYFTFEDISSRIVGPDNFFHSHTGITHKIQSFIGVFVYELGAFGVLILFLMGTILKKQNNWNWREITILFISLIPSIPLGMGLVPLLFGSKLKPIKIK